MVPFLRGSLLYLLSLSLSSTVCAPLPLPPASLSLHSHCLCLPFEQAENDTKCSSKSLKPLKEGTVRELVLLCSLWAKLFTVSFSTLSSQSPSLIQSPVLQWRFSFSLPCSNFSHPSYPHVPLLPSASSRSLSLSFLSIFHHHPPPHQLPAPTHLNPPLLN